MAQFTVTWGTPIYNGASSSFALGCPSNTWGFGAGLGGSISPTTFRGQTVSAFTSSDNFISNGIDACDLGTPNTLWSGASFVRLELWNSAFTVKSGELLWADSNGSGNWDGINFLYGASSPSTAGLRLYY